MRKILQENFEEFLEQNFLENLKSIFDKTQEIFGENVENYFK